MGCYKYYFLEREYKEVQAFSMTSALVLPNITLAKYKFSEELGKSN